MKIGFCSLSLTGTGYRVLKNDAFGATALKSAGATGSHAIRNGAGGASLGPNDMPPSPELGCGGSHRIAPPLEPAVKRSSFPASRQELRHTVMVPSMPGRGGNHRIRLARQPAHLLLMAGNGRRIHQRNSGSSGTQDDHDGSTIQSPFAGASPLGS